MGPLTQPVPTAHTRSVVLRSSLGKTKATDLKGKFAPSQRFEMRVCLVNANSLRQGRAEVLMSLGLEDQLVATALTVAVSVRSICLRTALPCSFRASMSRVASRHLMRWRRWKMRRIQASKLLLLLLVVAALLAFLLGDRACAQSYLQTGIDIGVGAQSVRVPVGTNVVSITAGREPFEGIVGSIGCQYNPTVTESITISGQIPPGMTVYQESGTIGGPPLLGAFLYYSVLAGQPTQPGAYELSITYAQSSPTFVMSIFPYCPQGVSCNPDDKSFDCSCPTVSYSVPLEIVVTEAQVDSLEITQGIQENKHPIDLYDWLSPGPGYVQAPLQLGDLPVPLVENKPALLRVYLKDVQNPTVAKVRIWFLPPGFTDPSQALIEDQVVNLVPGCTPRKQRLNLESSGALCHSADFYADKSLLKAGTFQLWVGLEDLTNIPSYCTDNNMPCRIPISTAGEVEWENATTGYQLGNPESTYCNSYLGYYPPTGLPDEEFSRTSVWGCTLPPVIVNKPDAIVLHPVSICDPSGSCGDVTEIKRMSAMLKQVAPTGTLKFGSTGTPLKIEPPAAGEPGDWWDRLKIALEEKAKGEPAFHSVPGERHIVYGVVSPAGGGDTLGIATIGGNSASSMSSAIDFPIPDGQIPLPGQNVETNAEVMAHETGHVFKLEHTGSLIPYAAHAAPGCHADVDGKAPQPYDPSDPSDAAYKNDFFWPYVNTYITFHKPDAIWDYGNYLFSGDPANRKMEAGLDFTRNRVRGTDTGEPNQSFEMMSYCVPRWVTPWSYTAMYQGLTGGTTTLIPLSLGTFDEVSGTVTASGIAFEPVFTLQTSGPTDQGSGSYRVEVRDSGGGVLYTRWFTPQGSSAQSTSGDVHQGPPYFTELVPHQAGAASIAVMNDTGTQVGTLHLGGVAPTVKITFPLGGETLQGIQNISWSATDPNSSSLAFRVQYSADNGTTWGSLTMSYHGLTLPINFDQLAGANGTALIRVYASDGVNTGQATSQPFIVPNKLPQAKISYPANGDVFHVGDFLNLEGIGFEADTGILSGASLTWSSSGLGGTLGTGDEVNFGILGESAVGTQTIKLTATDTAGNQATASINIVVQEQPPVVYPDLPPTANAGASYIGTEGSPVVFSGGGSYASDFTALTYAWNFGDGGTSTIQSPSHVFVDNGIYNVTLTVTDQKGRTATATATATIANVPPTVVAGAAATGKNTRPINLTASFSDPGLHDAPWKVTWTFGDGSTSPITSVSAQGAIAISHTYQVVGQFQVMVTVTDKDGASGSATIPVTITSIGDVNNDGKVDCADMAIVKASFGKKTGQAGFDARADVNGDGIVNVIDLSTVARQLPLGTTCP